MDRQLGVSAITQDSLPYPSQHLPVWQMLSRCSSLTRTKTCVTARVRQSMRWIEVLMWKKRDSTAAGTEKGRLCHQPPTALVKAIQSILAFSPVWPSTGLSVCAGENDGWTHCSFYLTLCSSGEKKKTWQTNKFGCFDTLWGGAKSGVTAKQQSLIKDSASKQILYAGVHCFSFVWACLHIFFLSSVEKNTV